MSLAALIVEADAQRTQALARWLGAAGSRADCVADAERAVAHLQAGRAATWLVIDLDGDPQTLAVLRSFHCTHALPPLLALAQRPDAARTAEALADGVARVLDWALPATTACQVLSRPPAAGPGDGCDLAALQLAGAGLHARIGLAQVVEQQGRRLLQDAAHGWLSGRAPEAAAAAARLEQVAHLLGAPGLARACRQFVTDAGTDVQLQRRAAHVRRELDGIVCALGRAALQRPCGVREGEGEADGIPGYPS
jgi:CheY-like chemotaxis protein